MATPQNQEPRINDQIRAQEVRLVSYDGEQVGIRSLNEALNMAQDMDLDLVEVAGQATPPVCRIMDYGKFKYEQSQKAKESRKKSTHILVKEMKYRPKIGVGDFNTKTRKVEEFLKEGSKVKVTIMFRGREMQHPELGARILENVADAVAEVGHIEVYPEREGRNMTMVLGSGKATQKQREIVEKLQTEITEEEVSEEEQQSEVVEDTENEETVEETS
ncbi:MAG: translation initiation factor IF-3 [Acidimicrobiales bacterium]